MIKDIHIGKRILLMNIFDRLLHHYGQQNWWPSDSPFEVIIGAILTQSASWRNVEKAIGNLKHMQVLDPVSLLELPHSKLAEIIRPSIYFNTKARKIKAFCAYLREYYNFDLNRLLEHDLETLRWELLSIYGIGYETADAIILYAAQQPIFVIDNYTRRIFNRLDLAPRDISYASLQELFTLNLQPNLYIFNEYHALLDQHGAAACKKTPICQDCCLLDICPTGMRYTS